MKTVILSLQKELNMGGLVGNERGNCESFITEHDMYRCRAVSWRRGAGVRRFSAEQAARLVSPVFLTQNEKAGNKMECVSSHPPFDSPNPAYPSGHPATRSAPTSLNPSVCLPRACGIESLHHSDACVPSCLVRG